MGFLRYCLLEAFAGAAPSVLVEDWATLRRGWLARGACFVKIASTVVVVLSLAVAPAWTQRIESIEDLERAIAEGEVLMERNREAMQTSDDARVVLLTNLLLEKDAGIKLCEAYRFGLKTLDDALNKELASVPTAMVENYRNQVAILRAVVTLLPQFGGDGEDWNDLGWGEDCDFDVLKGFCGKGGMVPLGWEQWSKIFLHLGMYVEWRRMSLMGSTIPRVTEEYCGVPLDE